MTGNAHKAAAFIQLTNGSSNNMHFFCVKIMVAFVCCIDVTIVYTEETQRYIWWREMGCINCNYEATYPDVFIFLIESWFTQTYVDIAVPFLHRF